MPEEFQNASPPSLYHAIVSWMYSDAFPAHLVLWGVERYEWDENIGWADWDRPIDMDKRYPDEWIQNKMIKRITGHIKDNMDERMLQEWVPSYPWVDPKSEPPSWGVPRTTGLPLARKDDAVGGDGRVEDATDF